MLRSGYGNGEPAVVAWDEREFADGAAVAAHHAQAHSTHGVNADELTLPDRDFADGLLDGVHVEPIAWFSLSWRGLTTRWRGPARGARSPRSRSAERQGRHVS